MRTKTSRTARGLGWAVVCVLATMLSACGGGGEPSRPADEVSAQAQASQACANQLDGYMREWYYFNGQAPHPDASLYPSIEDYFYAELFTVEDRSVASDHWSFVMDTAEYDQYFGEGKQVGFGVEVLPHDNGKGSLDVRSVDVDSPAAVAGLRRGDKIVSVNGQAASTMDARSLDRILYASIEGQALSLRVQSGVLTRQVDLRAAVYAMTLLPSHAVLATTNGKKVGYVRLDGFIGQVQSSLHNALQSIDADPTVSKDALILDLRYDRGGSIDLAVQLLSDLVGAGHENDIVANMQFNTRHRDQNRSVYFDASELAGWKAVYVLTSPDTCSASELVINSLKPYVPVVQIGGRTCGKPFGFYGVTLNHCEGKVFNAVNFEMFNRDGNGRYYQGLAPTCEVSDDLTHEPGDAREALTAAALSHIDTHVCPSTQGSTTFPSATLAAPRVRMSRSSMWINAHRQ